MTKTRSIRSAASLALAFASACGGSTPSQPTPAPAPQSELRYDQLPRLRFNQLALQLDLPVFWASDADRDGAVDPAEVRALMFYPTTPEWTEGERFSAAFDNAYRALVAASEAPAPSDERQRLVLSELDSAAPTLIENDLTALPAEHRAFAAHMRRVADLIDQLYAQQVGMTALVDQVPAEPASRSLFRRNWGPGCEGSATEANPACSAIPGSPRQPVGVYPASIQTTDAFCATLEQHARQQELLTPFTVVREREGDLVAVPYTEEYQALMQPIAAELRAAADAMTDPAEEALRTYLRAAAQSFTDNDWDPANEAWAAMNARNSRWYVRVGPDEVYWDPCSHKAGFHLSFALINQGSLAWQDRLTPLQQRMEAALAQISNRTYTARDVSFHLPDFIDLVINSGDDRDAFGVTIGQSLPNWGPVAEEGRGRTVAMTNVYTDPDSTARRREEARSLLTAEAMEFYTDDDTAGLLSTILHEATHNLGPSHEYEYRGQTDTQAFGGGMSSMLEELKAQSGALYYLRMLRENGIIEERMQRQAYVDSIVWAFGHISRGMYTPSGQRKAYSQLAAVQVGFLLEHGALRWDPDAMAANGTDRGAFSFDLERFPTAADELMQTVVRIKARNDRAQAESLATRYVDGQVVPQATIVERYGRFPRASFVYSLRM